MTRWAGPRLTITGQIRRAQCWLRSGTPVAVGLPLMADHQVSGAPIENQPPCVYVAYTWPAPTPVKLAFDSRHARSNPSLSALSI